MTSCGGVCGIEAFQSHSVTISHNEISHVQPLANNGGCDWDGIDLDGSTDNMIVEYNFTHDNYGPGLYGYMWNSGSSAWGPNTYRFNISQNDGAGANLGGLTISNGGGPGQVNIYRFL